MVKDNEKVFNAPKDSEIVKVTYRAQKEGEKGRVVVEREFRELARDE